MEGVKTPSEQCRGTLEQDTESTDAQIGPWDEQAPQSGVDPAYTHVSTLPVTPKGLKQARRWNDQQSQITRLKVLATVHS